MSQFFIQSSGVIPPGTPTSFTTDVKDNTTSGPGTAIPALNILQVKGRDTNQDNINGIRTDADLNNSNNLYVELTNRIHGTATTTDGVTTVPIYSFPLGAVPGTYHFTVNISAYNVTKSIGAGYTSFTTVRTTGAAGVFISGTPGAVSEEGLMSGVTLIDGVTVNNYTLDVIGLAGDTIHWVAVSTYVFSS